MLSHEALLASFLAVGADNKAKSAEDRYKYVSIDAISFQSAKLLPEKEGTPVGTVRVDFKINDQEVIYYTNNFDITYFEKFERGVLVNVEAKRWYDADGEPLYEGRTTLWTIDRILVAPVKAGVPLTD